MTTIYNRGMSDDLQHNRAGREGREKWDPDAALESLKLEQATYAEAESPEDTCRRLLKENAPRAILSLVHIANHSANDRVRLDAAKYITDRVLGRIIDSTPAGTQDPLERIAQLLAEPENQNASAVR